MRRGNKDSILVVAVNIRHKFRADSTSLGQSLLSAALGQLMMVVLSQTWLHPVARRMVMLLQWWQGVVHCSSNSGDAPGAPTADRFLTQ